MGLIPVIGTRYPYLPVRVRVGEEDRSFEALVDTGLDGDLILPVETDIEEDPQEFRRWAFADGTIVEAPVYFDAVRLGHLDPVPATIALLGEEFILGRGIVDLYRVTFDRGARIVVEP